MSEEEEISDDTSVEELLSYDEDEFAASESEEEEEEEENFSDDEIVAQSDEPKASSVAQHVYVTVVPEGDRVTSNLITKHEMTEAIGIRAAQIENGSPVFTNVAGYSNPIDMARKEFYDRRSPLILVRAVEEKENRKVVEKWRVNEMAYPTTKRTEMITSLDKKLSAASKHNSKKKQGGDDEALTPDFLPLKKEELKQRRSRGREEAWLDAIPDGVVLLGEFDELKEVKEWVPDDFPDKSKFAVTKESVISVSRKDESRKLCNEIVKKLRLTFSEAKRKVVVTDATAGAGGNTLAFARSFQSVNAVEINEITCDALRRNAEMYSDSRKKIVVRCDDYLRVASELTQTVVFFDPPWGGADYWKAEKLMLYLGETPVFDAVNAIQQAVRLVVVKVPSNFDFEQFRAKVMEKKKAKKIEKVNYKNHSMVFVSY
jgi:16S rRNA G966 N2-methylase RsmD/DNA-directed RNA polymerase subunit K/omega